jgi:hypothetical protein
LLASSRGWRAGLSWSRLGVAGGVPATRDVTVGQPPSLAPLRQGGAATYF